MCGEGKRQEETRTKIEVNRNDGCSGADGGSELCGVDGGAEGLRLVEGGVVRGGHDGRRVERDRERDVLARLGRLERPAQPLHAVRVAIERLCRGVPHLRNLVPLHTVISADCVLEQMHNNKM